MSVLPIKYAAVWIPQQVCSP